MSVSEKFISDSSEGSNSGIKRLMIALVFAEQTVGL